MGEYYICVKGENSKGWGDWCSPVRINVSSGTYIPENYNIQREFILYQVSPNPVYNSCIFKYTTPEEGEVRLSIFDIAGRNVVNLVDKQQTPGFYSIKWDGRTRKGEYMSSGVYFYRLSVNNYIATKKFVLFR